MINGVYILSGSNLSDRAANLAMALERIEVQAGSVLAQSQLYETAAWGLEAQPSFLNQVLEIATELKPEALLECLLSIEKQLGRERKQKWGERIIDLDILYFGDRVINTPRLQVPHPYIVERRFTLTPLCELAPLLVHPVLEKNQLQLLEECQDKLAVRIYGE
jgi:2-amino-4-hydroxy-6-hydroxymethyldihydropteridine diphosphokinase